MKEYITIQNLGPLKNLTTLELKPFTILIGESAIGKSTLMKIISMMRYIYKMTNIRSYLRLSNITSSPFQIRLENLMKKSELWSMLTSETIVDYEVQTAQGNSYHITIENKRLNKLPQISKEDLQFIKVSFISENRNIIPTWVEKASTNAGASLGFYFHETNNDFSSATELNQTIDLNYVNLKLHVTHPKGKNVKLRIEHKNDEHIQLDLREASSGIQTSAPLALIVNHFAHNFSFKDAFNRSVLIYLHDIGRLTKFKAVTESSSLKNLIFVHIEEPELSLFPDAQCKLIDELIYTATHTESDRKLNLMFATHSPYILNYINIILHQSQTNKAQLNQSDVAVYRLFDGEAQNLMSADENGNILVDTYDLTEMMGRIYQEYNSLTL